MRTGVPRSVLLGRVPKKGEPEWLPDDLDDLLELQALEDAVCPGGCGQPIGEAWDPDNRDAYGTELHWCGGCAAKDRAKRRAATREEPGNEPTDGLKIISIKDRAAVDDGD